jgi:hypothetical protein
VAEGHSRLSLLVNKQIQLPALVLDDGISGPYNLRTIGAGNRDFSVLVDDCDARIRRDTPLKEFAPAMRPKLTDLASLFGAG